MSKDAGARGDVRGRTSRVPGHPGRGSQEREGGWRRPAVKGIASAGAVALALLLPPAAARAQPFVTIASGGEEVTVDVCVEGVGTLSCTALGAVTMPVVAFTDFDEDVGDYSVEGTLLAWKVPFGPTMCDSGCPLWAAMDLTDLEITRVSDDADESVEITFGMSFCDPGMGLPTVHVLCVDVDMGAGSNTLHVTGEGNDSFLGDGGPVPGSFNELFFAGAGVQNGLSFNYLAPAGQIQSLVGKLDADIAAVGGTISMPDSAFCGAIPVPETCGDATLVVPGTPVFYDTSVAEPSEVVPPCAGGGGDVWYVLKTPEPGLYSVSASGVGGGPAVAAYAGPGCPAPGTPPVACSEDASVEPIFFEAQAGEVVYIQVAGSGEGGSGLGVLEVELDGGVDCLGDCNGDGAATILDFICFENEWQLQTAKGDCDGNGEYNILDFVCFQGEFDEFAGGGCD